MNRFQLAVISTVFCSTAIAAQTPDTVVLDKTFQQIPMGQTLVTPNGGLQMTLSAALAGSNITGSSPIVVTGSVVSCPSCGTSLATVESVGLSLPSIFAVTGSPVTNSGTLTGTLVSQTANAVWAAPNGSAGAPAFRGLVGADLPLINLSSGVTGTLPWSEIGSTPTTLSGYGITNGATLGANTYTGKQITAASATGGSGFTLPEGTAPTSPVNGDVWTTSAGIFVQIAGSTIGPLGTGGGSSVTWPTSGDLVVSNSTSSPAGLAPVNGDCVVGSGGAWTAGACGTSSTPTNTQTGTSYVVLASDQGKLITLNNASGGTVTLPQAGTTGFAATWGTCILNVGTGSFTVTPTTSTFNLQSSQILSTGVMMCPVSDGTNYSGGVSNATSGVTFPLHVTGAIYGGVRSVSGTTDTLLLSDCGNTVEYTNASAVAVTVPATLPVGCQVAMSQYGAGKVSPTAASGGTLHSPHSYTGTSAEYSEIYIHVIENAGGSAAVFSLLGDAS